MSPNIPPGRSHWLRLLHVIEQREDHILRANSLIRLIGSHGFHHLLAVMRCLIADQRIQPMQMENLMPKHEKPVSAYPAEEHALALNDLLKLLARLLAKRQLELNSPDPEGPKSAPDA